MRRGCEAARKSSRRTGPSSSWSTCFMCYGDRSIRHSYGTSTGRRLGGADQDGVQAEEADHRRLLMAKKRLNPGAAEKDKMIANQALALAEYAAKVLVAGE